MLLEYSPNGSTMGRSVIETFDVRTMAVKETPNTQKERRKECIKDRIRSEGVAQLKCLVLQIQARGTKRRRETGGKKRHALTKRTVQTIVEPQSYSIYGPF